MRSKPNFVVGLDIGTTNITVVVASVSPEGKIEITGVGSSPSKGLRKGVVINIEATVDSISKAINQAETMSGIEIKSVYAAISGSHIKGFNSHGIVGIKNREVSQQDIDKVIEAAKAVAIPLDREILHVIPQEFIIDEQDGIKEPLGISGVRLEARVHIITGAVASAQNIVKCANRCGLKVNDIILSPIASAMAVLTAEEQELGVALVDIGGGTTDLTVFQSGAVKHTAVISVGGNHITNDIAAGMRTPISAAEEIKCNFGAEAAEDSSDSIDVSSTGGRAPRSVSRQVLSEIIEPRVKEMLTLLQREIVRSESDQYLTSGIVLTGGAAKLKGLERLTEEVFNLPVRVGYPRGVSGLNDLVNMPEYATAVGLILHAASNGVRSRGLRDTLSIGGLIRRVGNWFGDHF